MEQKRKSIPERLTVFAIVAIVAVFFAFLWMFASYAKDNAAAAMRIKKTEGTVKVAQSTGKEVAILKNMKLKNGNKIDTEEESYAWISLDDEKLLKMDAVSEAIVRKNGKKLEILLESGNLFFEVSEPLEDEEVLNIRTSTMTIGIRGTSGWLNIIDDTTVRIGVLEGNVKVCATNPLTGRVKTDYVSTGESAVCVVYDESNVGGVERCDILKEKHTKEGIDGFVLAAVVPDKALCEKIYTQGGVDLRNVTEEEVDTRLKEEQEEMRRKMKEIGRILDTQEARISVEGVWAHQTEETAADAARPGDQETADNPARPEDQETTANPARPGDRKTTVNPTRPEDQENSANPKKPGSTANPETPKKPAPTGVYYTVDFDANGGTDAPASQTVRQGGRASSSLAPPIRQGYRFTGWYTSRSCEESELYDFGKVLTGSIILYAGWDNSYTVTFSANGGTGAPASQKVQPGGKAAEPSQSPIRTGHIFKGWYTDQPCTTKYDFATPVMNTLMLFAGWEIDTNLTHTVTFDVNGGSGSVAAQTKNGGDKVSEPTGVERPTRDDYRFTGWYTDSACTKKYLFNTAVTDSFTLYAGWKAIVYYTVKFDVNRGSGAFADQRREEGQTAARPTSNPTRGGYKFTDWYEDSACTVLYDFTTAVMKNLTLYAGWAINTNLNHTVTFMKNDGSNVAFATQSVRGGNQVQNPSSVPTRVDYKFTDCWYKDSECTQPYSFTQQVTESFPLYAGWERVAYSGQDGSIKYEYKLENKTLIISGTGEMKDYDVGKQPWADYLSEAEKIEVQGVTGIGANAFLPGDAPAAESSTFAMRRSARAGGAAELSNLVNIKIATSVTNIKANAFAGCGNVKSVYYLGKQEEWRQKFPGFEQIDGDKIYFFAGKEVYYRYNDAAAEKALILTGSGEMENYWSASYWPWDSYRAAIQKVEIREGITSIGRYALYGCSSLKGITFPDSVTSVGNGAFENCSALKSVALPNTLTSIGDWAFKQCSALTGINLPAGITSIGSETFRYSGLTSITLPAGLTSIGGYAFDECRSLTAISIPEGVARIENYTFQNCTALSSVTLPSDLKAIGYRAFSGCSALKGITLPEEITLIESYAFGWSGLTGIEIPGSVDELRNGAFYYCRSLTSAVLKYGIPSIGETNTNYAWDGVFEGCTALRAEGIKIPNSVTTLGRRAFAGCTGLTELMLPESVTAVDSGALSGCTNLTDITVPAAFTSVASAFSGNTNLTSVKILKDNNITSIGDSAFNGCSLLANVTLPDNITSIGSSAFYGCSRLLRITLPGSVTSIGNNAFRRSGLTSIILPAGLTSIGYEAFKECGSLASVSIPEGVKRIENNTFQDCTSLSAVTLRSGLNEVGYYAFAGCSALKGITLPDGVTLIESYAFGWSGLTGIDIPESVTEIRNGAFYYCRSLASVELQDGIKSIGETNTNYGWDGVFEGCIALPANGIKIPGSVKTIGRRAFVGCTGLTSVVIPPGVTTIGGGALLGCTGLVTVDVPAALTKVDSVFSGCTNLTSVTISKSEGVTKIGNSAFSGCSSLSGITFPDNITTIGDGAFYDCKALQSVPLPDSVTSIGNYAFKRSGLVSITLPVNLTSIGSEAFRECGSLASVSIPEGVKRIENYTFNDCTSLSAVTLVPGLNEVGYYAFASCSALKGITLPAGVTLIESYAFGWSGLTGIDIPESVTEIRNGAFYYCRSLASVGLQDGIKSIGETNTNYGWDGVFEGCIALPANGIKIPGSVMTLGRRAFANCTQLTAIRIPNSVRNTGSGVFEGCNGLTDITVPAAFASGSSVFSGCNNLKSVTLLEGDGTTSIGSYAFSGLKKLERVTIPDNVTGIGDRAFQNCIALTSVKLPNGIATIGEYAFYNSGLTEINLPNSITALGSGAFYNTALTSVTIPEKITILNSYMFYGCSKITTVTLHDKLAIIKEHAFTGCSSLTSIRLPDKVRNVEDNVFQNCMSLASVELSPDLTQIGNYAFDGCSSLTSITIPEKVVWIYNNAFSRCGLTEINLPDSVANIGNSAFENCTALKTVTIPGSISSIGSQAFYNCGDPIAVTFGGAQEQWKWDGCFSTTLNISYAGTPAATSLEEEETVSENDVSSGEVSPGDEEEKPAVSETNGENTDTDSDNNIIEETSPGARGETVTPPETPDDEKITPPAELDDKIEESPADSENEEIIPSTDADNGNGTEALPTVSEDGGEELPAMIDNECYL